MAVESLARYIDNWLQDNTIAGFLDKTPVARRLAMDNAAIGFLAKMAMPIAEKTNFVCHWA